MKTKLTFKIALLILIGSAIHFNAKSEDFLYKTTLAIKETITYTPVAPALCDGAVAVTPTPPVMYDAFRLMTTPADFTKVSFRVFLTENLTTPLYSYLNLNPGDVNYNATTGEINYTLTGIATSRKSYTVRVYLDDDGTDPYFEQREFNTTQTRTDSPIGTIIPYYGSEASVAALNLGGWFLCDGTSVASISDAILFPSEKSTLTGIIGANFPDLRGLFLRGGGTNGYDPASPRSFGNVQTEQAGFTAHYYDKINTPSGSTDVGLSVVTSPINTGDGSTGTANVVTSVSLGNGNHSHSISTTPTLTNVNGTAETRPDNVAVTYIIKARY